MEGDGVGRFGQDVEAAVDFAALEALQNVAKYAEATQTTIALSNGDGSLTFTVTRTTDVGFDPAVTAYGTGLQGIADRLAALDGTLTMRERAWAGTILEGRIPVPATGGST